MSRFWSIDSPIMSGLGTLADMILLNIVYIICCLPVITIGASTTALYTVTLKMVRKEYPAVLKSFFKAFRKNFKHSTLCWIPAALTGLLLLVDLRIMGLIEGAGRTVLLALLGIVLVVYIMVMTYLFPYIARFENTIRQTFKNVLLISIAHLPATLLMAGITIALAVLVFFSARTFVLATIVGFFFGFAALAYLKSLLLTRIFKKHE